MGLEGRAYTPSGHAQALENSRLRHYQKYIKPVENAKFDHLKNLAGAASMIVTAVEESYNPLDYVKAYHEGTEFYDKYLNPANYEAQRMAGNAPGDLTGKAYKGPTKIYH